MGFSSIDDWISETTGGKFFRSDWMKQNNANTGVAGSWIDCSMLAGYPPAMVHGERAGNTNPWCTASSGWGWTFTGTFNYGANLITKPNDTTVSTATCAGRALVNGKTYRTVFTISGYAGSGTITLSLNGTAGTARSSSATFTENIVAGASGGIVFTSSATTVGGSISLVSVIETKAAFDMDDTTTKVPLGALYHGGNVSTDTKHILNAEAHSVTATWNPCVWLLVDLLMCYPLIDMNSTSEQNFINDNTLPRYTDGKGVRAYLVPSTTLGAVAHNISIKYTNTDDVDDRMMPVTVAGTSGALVPRIDHSGVAANNYAPFLPLAPGDIGMKKVDHITISAGTGASQFATLMLCKPLMSLPQTTAAVASERDLMNQLPSLPRVYDGACLAFLCFLGGNLVASTSSAYGYIDFCWG